MAEMPKKMSENIENMTVREAWHPYQRECGFKSQKKVEECKQFDETMSGGKNFRKYKIDC